MCTCVKKGAEWDYAKCGALDVLIFTYEKKNRLILCFETKLMCFGMVESFIDNNSNNECAYAVLCASLLPFMNIYFLSGGTPNLPQYDDLLVPANTSHRGISSVIPPNL